MHIDVTSNVCSPSTTFEWRKVKICRDLHEGGVSPQARRSALALRWRNRHKPLQVRFWYVGGPNSSWVLQYRGVEWRFDGFVSLDDVGAFMNGEDL